MKLLSPCCQNQQDYSPRKKWDGHSRRTTLCKKCKKVFDIDKDTLIEEEEVKNIEETKSIPPNTTQEHTLIDDPNELLMSTAMRELNKTNPEVRWANVLLQLLDKTKQLEAKSKSEVQSKLKQYSITELIELRKKLIES